VPRFLSSAHANSFIPVVCHVGRAGSVLLAGAWEGLAKLWAVSGLQSRVVDSCQTFLCVVCGVWAHGACRTLRTHAHTLTRATALPNGQARPAHEFPSRQNHPIAMQLPYSTIGIRCAAPFAPSREGHQDHDGSDSLGLGVKKKKHGLHAQHGVFSCG
jgi:hypothetical protein